ncbi:MAG: tRNA (guanosine(37)-N1)-methyltransferase TrmD, partial [Bacteroidales bacterium]|nr:tRNA (guanosine(37)-N1)-methyltransferase TrmD [Candidatus Cryptobacteroides fimicaballi]
MRIDILSVVPELLDSPLSHSIVGRAIKKGLVEIHVHNLRKYGIGPRKNVDDYSYGGDAGMVMMVEPVFNMIRELKSERDYDEVIYMSPDGEILDQGICNELSLKGNIIILCGHYKGIDHRIREHLITREISVGNYVVSGGEIPAALLADSLVRLIPGALTDETSALSDSFQEGLVSAPVYTRPAEFNGWKVPEVLLCGDPKKIRAWQDEQALQRTKALRPELLDENTQFRTQEKQ